MPKGGGGRVADETRNGGTTTKGSGMEQTDHRSEGAQFTGFFFLVQTKMSWRFLRTVANLSESTFRAVQFYDDPTNHCGGGSDTY